METTGLVEIVLGVESLDRSQKVYADGLGLDLLSQGIVDVDSSSALWGSKDPLPAAVLGRSALSGAPRIRLLQTTESPIRPPLDAMAIGPLGVGFTTQGIEQVQARARRAGVSFLSPPIELTPEPEGASGPRRFEVFGQTRDSEFVVLIERQNVDTPYGTISDTWHTSEPLHTSHVVRDLTAASRFMCTALDHEVIFREECLGSEFEQLMGVPANTRFRFEMLRHPDHSIGRIIFIEYETMQTRPNGSVPAEARPVAPPARGLVALRYDCSDLEAAVTRARLQGGTVARPITEVDSELLGRGRVATLESPVGLLIELWEPH